MADLSSNSQLLMIIQRLLAMEAAGDQRFQVRRFDAYGIEVLKVTLDQENQVWTIAEHQHNQVYHFDDLDLVAIEIYELLRDVQETF
ncbi:DUF1797 family protein [Leuconostocaceae bacterium ESL0958]|nr:DUF1797 family protein [Leuconostocaceae bacterium ESL0958]